MYLSKRRQQNAEKGGWAKKQYKFGRSNLDKEKGYRWAADCFRTVCSYEERTKMPIQFSKPLKVVKRETSNQADELLIQSTDEAAGT